MPTQTPLTVAAPDASRRTTRTTRTTRIGRKMRRVLELASMGPIARIDAARRVGPHGSLCYGYATVNRCIMAGLVEVTTIPGRRGIAIIAL